MIYNVDNCAVVFFITYGIDLEIEMCIMMRSSPL
jgi:hypothetical protein